MEELVKQNENGQVVTTSLLVAEKFSKNHRDVMRSIQELLTSAQNCAHLFVETTYLDSYNREQPMYAMNRDGFSLLVMGFTGKEALKFKLDFIGAFNKMETMLQSDEYILMRSQTILQGMVKRLEFDNARKDEVIEHKNNEIKVLAPKAEYYDNTLTSKDTMTITQIAKELGMSGQLLNRKLCSLNIQYKVNGQWVLYSKYQDKGYTKTETYTEIINGETRTFVSTVWTQKGREIIHNSIKKVENLVSMN